MRGPFISFTFILCMAASPALADHVKGAVGFGLARTTLATDRAFEKSVRPFFVVDLSARFNLRKTPLRFLGREVEPFVSVKAVGGSLLATAVNEVQGDYGATFWLSPTTFWRVFHNSNHPAVSTSTPVPFRFSVGSVDGVMFGWAFR